MYTAEVIDKKMVRGLLSVEVKFSNGEGAEVIETFETNQSQDATWLDDAIKKKINHLDSIAESMGTIKLGVFQKDKDPIVKSDKDIYQEKAQLYLRYMNVARQGFIQSDRPIILELREWLRDNFQDEFVELF